MLFRSTFQEIFKNHWSEFVNIQKAKGKSIRQSILKNVEKMIHCKDLSLGYLFFECPKCNNFHIQGHPAMSESRILSYDKDKGMIYYYYDPHEDDAILNDSDKIGRQYVCESVYEFIAKLIIHIPLDNIHLTRYYGFYANHSSLDISNQHMLFSYYDLHRIKSNLNWRKRLLSSYHYDPHEDDVLDEDDPGRLGRQYVYESVFKFMKKLVRHIPNKGFHNIRYYGFYSKRSTIDTSSIRPLYSTSELNKIKQNINWNKKMKLTYGYEPLLCSCGKRLEFCPELSFFPPPKGPKQLSIDDFDEEGNLYA